MFILFLHMYVWCIYVCVHICRGTLVFTCAWVCVCQRLILVVPLPSLSTLFTESGAGSPTEPRADHQAALLGKTVRKEPQSPPLPHKCWGSGTGPIFDLGSGYWNSGPAPIPGKHKLYSQNHLLSPTLKAMAWRKGLDASECYDQKSTFELSYTFDWYSENILGNMWNYFKNIWCSDLQKNVPGIN